MVAAWLLPPARTPQREGDEMAQDLSSGLTRFSLQCMNQRISLNVLGEMTQIPPPLLSMYALGRRQISRRHLYILAVALDVTPPSALRGLCTPDQIFVDEDEWSETHPLPKRNKYSLIPRHRYTRTAVVG